MILVTGAAKGLGAEICRHLASQGHDVVIHYRRSEKEALQVAEECRTHHVKAETIFGDFSSVESVNHFIAGFLKRFPQVKGIVNNVGNYLIASSLETEMAQWQELFQTNFFTPILLTRALVEPLKKQKGCVINIGVSGLQGKRGFTKATAYMASKSALLLYTVSLAKELAEKGVRVNMISPGYLENAVDLNDPLSLPLKRPALLSELARVVAFLFNPESEYITGQNIEVAGAVNL